MEVADGSFRVTRQDRQAARADTSYLIKDRSRLDVPTPGRLDRPQSAPRVRRARTEQILRAFTTIM